MIKSNEVIKYLRTAEIKLSRINIINSNSYTHQLELQKEISKTYEIIFDLRSRLEKEINDKKRTKLIQNELNKTISNFTIEDTDNISNFQV